MTKLKQGADGTPEAANTGQGVISGLPIDTVTVGGNTVVMVAGAACVPLVDVFLMQGADLGVVVIKDDTFNLVGPNESIPMHADAIQALDEAVAVIAKSSMFDEVARGYVELFGCSRRKLAYPAVSLSGMTVGAAGTFTNYLFDKNDGEAGESIGDDMTAVKRKRRRIPDNSEGVLHATGGDEADQLGDDGSMPDLIRVGESGITGTLPIYPGERGSKITAAATAWDDGDVVPTFIAAAALGAGTARLHLLA